MSIQQAKPPPKAAAMPPNVVNRMGMLRLTTSFGVFHTKFGEVASMVRAMLISR